MPDINTAMEDYLAALPDDDWRALCARVRPPDEPPKSPRPALMTHREAEASIASKHAARKARDLAAQPNSPQPNGRGN